MYQAFRLHAPKQVHRRVLEMTINAVFSISRPYIHIKRRKTVLEMKESCPFPISRISHTTQRGARHTGTLQGCRHALKEDSDSEEDSDFFRMFGVRNNMEDMNIRKAVAADLEAVNRLLREVLRVHHQGRPDLFRASGKKYSDDQLLAIFEGEKTPVFVYEQEGAVLGYAFCELIQQGSGSLMPLKTLYVDDICVDPAHQGKGIGRALFNHVKEFAASEGCHNVTLHVWECNPGAMAF